ncbi:MAG TPA: cysteine--tRNA ligase [Candidatus Paceibacterota bacterium]|nr:cysteine--tRNA ligase [Candidatus Paceibacterota bacterium]
MTVRLYNSLTRTVEVLQPRKDKHVDMFVCGPTVYDLVHIGNARTFAVFDVAAKWLRYRGFAVRYIQNITDVDDKIIARAAAEKEDPAAYAERYYREFMRDMSALGNTAVDTFVRATEHIPQVIAQVKALRDKGFAYLIEGDGWYFDLAKFPGYGKLSGRTALQADDAVSRIDENPDKRNPGDFCVWKISKPDEPSWDDDELGRGRPGWHIEDTAMTEAYFGPQYDLHGGGIDLKFPHHEAEIAQQEAASGKVPFVRHWMHAGFLQVAGGKMSKSVGNIISLRDALKQWPAEALRFFFLSAVWHEPLALSDEALKASAAAVQRLGELRRKLVTFSSDKAADRFGVAVADARAEVENAMDDDLNTPKAFGAVFSLVAQMNAGAEEGFSDRDASAAESFFAFVSEVFGVVPSASHAPAEVDALVGEREQARARKDWDVADRIRGQLGEMGWTVDDTPYGPLVKKK